MKIPIVDGFSIIPEGTYVFKITDVTYDETYGKLEVKMKTAKGQKYTERFSLKKSDDSYNEGALGAFSYFAKVAMNDFNMTDIDPNELVGHYMRAKITHLKKESNKNPGKFVTFMNLGDKEPADGFDEEPEGDAPTSNGLNLDDLLGGN